MPLRGIRQQLISMMVDVCKKRLSEDTARFKEMLVETMLGNCLLKKALLWMAGAIMRYSICAEEVC